jgi:hypothetical protein
MRWLEMRHGRLAAVATLTALLLIAQHARSSHQFSDVPATAPYHAAASWLATRAVTLGCAVGLYCPNDVVTRGQMALFMNRLGVVLSPRSLFVTDSVNLTNFLNPVCVTAPVTPPYPQRVSIDAVTQVAPNNLSSSMHAYVAMSFNNGSTWTVDVVPASGSTSTTNPTGVFTVHEIAAFDLAPGVTHLFAIRLAQHAGGATAAAVNCQIRVTVLNRNPDGAVPE